MSLMGLISPSYQIMWNIQTSKEPWTPLRRTQHTDRTLPLYKHNIFRLKIHNITETLYIIYPSKTAFTLKLEPVISVFLNTTSVHIHNEYKLF